MNTCFKINGIHCPACKKLIERRISGIKGVNSVSVNIVTGETQVVSDETITKAEIQTALKGSGYKVV